MARQQPSERKLFRDWRWQQWLVPALLLLATWYGATAVFSTTLIGPLMRTGGDYRAFRAAAEIVRKYGFREVYNLQYIDEFQRAWYSTYATGPNPYSPSPWPYPPVVLLPTLLLLPFDPWTGFFIWTAVDMALLALYLWHFRRRLGSTINGPVLALLLLSLPVFMHFLVGQVNVWLLIFFGEFLLASERGQDFTAGLWLGGLLIKPQALVLLLPGLLIARRFKTLAGFAVVGLLVLVASLLLVGIPGMMDLAHLLQLSTAGATASNSHAEEMMTWRSLALNLSSLLPAGLAWTLAIAGLAATAIAGLAFFFRRMEPGTPRLALALLGAYAATCAVTWHAHLHLALPLAAPLLWLYARGQAPMRLLAAWSLAPAGLYVLAALAVPPYSVNVGGLGMLAANLALLGWAAKKYWSPLPDQSSLDGAVGNSP